MRLRWDRWLNMLLVCAFAVSVGFSIYFAEKMFEAKTPPLEPIGERPRYHFVLVPEEMDNDYWRLVEKGAQDAAEKYGVYVEYTGPRQADMEEHIQTIEKAAASRVDGIMTQGLREDQFTPVINRVVEKGIPVLTIDTDAPGSKRLGYIGTDNYRAGFLAGRAMVDNTRGEVKVGIITGNFDASHQQLRVQGFRDAVEDIERIDIVDIRESNITRIEATEKAYGMIREHPEINAFFGTSALDGIGIVEVLKREGKLDDTYIIAFDILPETLDLIREGQIEATVVQQPYEMGFMGVEVMLDIMRDEPVKPLNHTETRVIYKADLASFRPYDPEGDAP